MAEKKFQQPSSAQSHFSVVPSAQVERSSFDRSFSHKTTFDHGRLIPVFLDEVLPGDTFDVQATALVRLATPLKPFMDNVHVDIHFFFVPNRLVWDNWRRFMGEQNDPTDVITGLVVPKTAILLNREGGTVADYFGIPRNMAAATDAQIWVNALPFRAYQLIYNEWYRDQNLNTALVVNKSDNGSTVGNIGVVGRLKKHDYFTSALPWPQKGSAVTIPILSQANVITNNLDIQIKGATDGSSRNMTMFNNTEARVGYTGGGITSQNARFGAQTGLVADLTSATAVTINDLRTAFQIQKLLERDARGGTRYIEIILSHFGVSSDDHRLQRPEYLGGGRTMMNINPIASTAGDVITPIGNLAAYAQTIGRGGFVKSFTEHGFVIGIASTQADQTYQHGVDRMFLRRTRYDYYWPALSHLGEQAILNMEVFAQGGPLGAGENTATDRAAWGYQERYAEYRYRPSRVTGKFASTDAQSLDVWHLAQEWTALPPLNFIFIAELAPISRVIAVPEEPQYLADFYFKFRADRAMPVYSVPGLVDHF